MAEFKLVLSAKDGKSYQKGIKDEEANPLIGKKIGDPIKGDDIGFAGYEFMLTGGSDKCGFPMRKDVAGTSRKKILAVSGIGLKKKGKGVRQRKTVCGNTLHAGISQVNLKVTKEGKEPLAKPEEKESAAPEEKKQAEKKESAEKPKEEQKKEEKAAEKQESAAPPKQEKPAEKPKK